MLPAERFDLVHAHYGLAGWCAALAGARPLAVTFHGTDVRHRIVGLAVAPSRPARWTVAGASRALFEPENGRPGLPLDRPRPPSPCFPAAPTSAGSRPPCAQRRAGASASIRAAATSSFPPRRPGPVSATTSRSRSPRLAGAELLTVGAAPAEQMPDWVNAARPC